MIGQPSGIPGDQVGVTLFSSTPMNSLPSSAWNFYQPSSPPMITYVQALFRLTPSTSRHGVTRPAKRYPQVTKTLPPRPSTSRQRYNNRHKGTKRPFLPHRQDRPPYREPGAALWNNLHGIGETREEEARERKPETMNHASVWRTQSSSNSTGKFAGLAPSLR